MWIVFKDGMLMSCESFAIMGEQIVLLDNEHDARTFSISRVKYVCQDSPLKPNSDGTISVVIEHKNKRRSEWYKNIRLS